MRFFKLGILSVTLLGMLEVSAFAQSSTGNAQLTTNFTNDLGPGRHPHPHPHPAPQRDICVGTWHGQYNNGVGLTMSIWRTGGDNIQMTIYLSNYPQPLPGNGTCYMDGPGHAVINYSGNGMPHTGEISNYVYLTGYQEVAGGFSFSATRE